LGGAGRPVGHIFIHKGDESGFVAERGVISSTSFSQVCLRQGQPVQLRS